MFHADHPPHLPLTGQEAAWNTAEPAAEGAQKLPNTISKTCFFETRYRTVYVVCHHLSKKKYMSCTGSVCIADPDGALRK